MATPSRLELETSRLTGVRSTDWAMESNVYLRIKPPDRKPHRIYSRNVKHLRSGQVCKQGRYIFVWSPCGAPPSSKLGWYSPCSFHHAYRATIQNYAYSMNLSSGLIHGVFKPTYAHISSPLSFNTRRLPQNIISLLRKCAAKETVKAICHSWPRYALGDAARDRTVNLRDENPMC